MTNTRRVLMAIVVAALAVSGLAQEPHNVPSPTLPPGVVLDAAGLVALAPQWGPTGETMVQVLSYAFRPRNAASTYDTFFDTGFMYRTAGTAWFYAPLSLPAGASVTAVGVDWYDESTTEDPTIGLFCMKADRTLDYLVWSYYPTSAGYTSFNFVFSSPHTVDHANYYALVIDPKLNGQDIQWRGMRVYYTLQISPAPGVASFTDVPVGHPSFQVVEALKASGITQGCTATQFCPTQPVTRQQMATFLARALGLHWPN